MHICILVDILENVHVLKQIKRDEHKHAILHSLNRK